VPTDATLDAGETGCGDLIMLIARAVRGLAPGQTVEVMAYDLAAGADIPAWCRSTGNALVSAALDTHPQRFVIRKRPERGDSRAQAPDQPDDRPR
jgi:tRNA 2-thiouridine synthesizing protein A